MMQQGPPPDTKKTGALAGAGTSSKQNPHNSPYTKAGANRKWPSATATELVTAKELAKTYLRCFPRHVCRREPRERRLDPTSFGDQLNARVDDAKGATKRERWAGHRHAEHKDRQATLGGDQIDVLIANFRLLSKRQRLEVREFKEIIDSGEGLELKLDPLDGGQKTRLADLVAKVRDNPRSTIAKARRRMQRGHA
jgi:hypothetical protein